MSILNVQLPRDNKGNITIKANEYKPDQSVKDRTQQVLDRFAKSNNIMTNTYPEFNDMTVIDRQSLNQRLFNAYQEPQSGDPDEDWHSQAIRPIVRNKIISIAAHITSNLIFPKIFAQNDKDEIDKDASQVMRDLHEWRADQANYEKNFLYAVMAALTNPAVIYHTEYSDAYRVIREEKDGEFIEKVVKDELYSGFQDTPVPVDELFIENIRENDIQKQGYLIWRKMISYDVSEAKYGTNNNFREHVRPGIQVVFDEATDSFYDLYDEDMSDNLVEEVIYWDRRQDLKLVFVNGVLLTHHNQPNPRLDKNYPFAKTGYELFDEGKFFYYRSLAQKLEVDEQVVNTLYRMIIDGSYLKLMRPGAVFGDDIITSSVIAPGKITSFQTDSRFEPIDTGADLNAGLAVLNKVEESVNESSQDPLQAGQASRGQQTAFEISRLEQNARTQMGQFGKMIGFLVKDLGQLFNSDIIQFMTVGEVDEIVGTGQLKFRNFLIPEKSTGGKKKARKVVFDGEMEDEITEEQREMNSFKLLEEEGGLDSDKEITKVNPSLFRKLKFLMKISADLVTPPSDILQKTLNLEAYDRAVQNPLANQEEVYRELLLGSYDKTKDDVDRFVAEQQPLLTPQATGGSSPMQTIAKAQGGII